MRGDLMNTEHLDEEMRDVFQEIANVAMGRAANLLARLLNNYVVLPIPVVNLLERNELKMALSSLKSVDSVSAVCQGLSGPEFPVKRC